jgi:1,4-alpha-glucan branching enzyme
MKQDPLMRKGLQKALTFSLHYAFSERFLLPLSHDEVVHGKRSLASKMPGTPELQLENVRAMLCWQFLHPGKKLLFMGGELGQWREWNFDGELDWSLLGKPEHRALRELVQSLNALYRKTPALHQVEDGWAGFEWIDFSDAARSVITFVRRGKKPKDTVVVALNFTPVEWEDYAIAVPEAGKWRVVFDTRGMGKRARTLTAAGGKPKIEANLPPLGAVVWSRVERRSRAKTTGSG